MTATFASPKSVALEDALQWTQDGSWLYEEKLDGYRAVYSEGGLRGRVRSYRLPGAPLPVPVVLDGELVGQVFHVFDILANANGADLRALPLWRRKRVLHAMEPFLPSWVKLVPWTRGNGGEFLEHTLGQGGEGVVAKAINARYGFQWFKAKRIETCDCVVMEILTGWVSLGQYKDGLLVDCGRCQIAPFALQGIQVGGVVEIACQSRAPNGKFREPRLLRIRTDKPAEACEA